MADHFLIKNKSIFIFIGFLAFIAPCCGVFQPNIVSRDTAAIDPLPGMVFIKGGSFIMGSANGGIDEKPAHRVAVESYFLDIHEVTVQQYARFLETTSHPAPDFWQPEFDRPNDPVVGVSWHDAEAYAVWAGKRLPTEAEWEYASRCDYVELPESAQKKNGAHPDRTANIHSSGITPVMSFPPNKCGLYDMIGNVWEWCSDWHDRTYYAISPPKNPRGPFEGTKKVVRGGAWYCSTDAARTTNRYYALPDGKSFHIGFRCAKSLK